jgi:pimeloyl-ACP methyl ester carboxylesterase
MLCRLNLNPRHVPSSNVVFVRSTRESTLSGTFTEIAGKSWEFHRTIIDQLGTRVVLCFGRSAGNWIAKQLAANHRLGDFVEKNKRRWRTVALSSSSGISVVVATHPGVADWTAPTSDPTPLVQQALEKA